MSEFETGRGSKTMLIAVVVIVIVGVGGFAGFMYLNGLTPTTTTTTPTTTTTTPTGGKTLTVLTRHDISIQAVYEPAFLASDLAIAAGITDVSWKAPLGEYWDELIDAGQVDVCWGGGPTLFDQLMRDNRLASLNNTYMQEV
ncbi:MAG: hypothetical protein RTU30_15835, partial [Candidatus Thorarchaeota archaeon]